jgi:hypothetical protein
LITDLHFSLSHHELDDIWTVEEDNEDISGRSEETTENDQNLVAKKVLDSTAGKWDEN